MRTPAAAQRRPRLRGRRAPPEFHPGRGRARDDPGGGQLSDPLVGGAARRAPVRARQGAGVADRGGAADRAAGRQRLRDAGATPFPAWSPRIRRCSRSAPRRPSPPPGWRRGSAASRSAIPISRCGCRTDNRLVDFSTGEFHAAIRVGRGDWPGLRCHFLFRLNFSPICSAEFAAAPPARAARAIARRAAAQPGDDWWARLARRDGRRRRATAAPIPASSSTIR